MTSGLEVFDISAHHAELESLPGSGFQDDMHQLLDDPLFARALSNSKVEAGADEKPPQIAAEIAYASRTDDEWYARADALRRQGDTLSADITLRSDFPTYRRALELSETILSDPRTLWSLERGITILPREVIDDVQSGYFNDRLPALRGGAPQVDRERLAAATGMTLAVGRIAVRTGTVSTRELIELTSAVGLGTSLKQEVASGLPDTWLYKDAGEYGGNILGTFTGSWLKLVEHLRDNSPFRSEQTDLDLEIDALTHSLETIIFAMRTSYEYEQRADGKLNQETLQQQLAFCGDLFMDIMNARWNIRGLPAVPEASMPSELLPSLDVTSEEDMYDVIRSSIELLKQCGVHLPENVTAASIRESLNGDIVVRGTFRPETSLRNALLEARKKSKNPEAVREHLRLLQHFIHGHTTQ